MRTILVADDVVDLDGWLEERRRRGGDLYDYEIGGVLRMNPAPRRSHGRWQLRLGQLLGQLSEAAGIVVGGPANLGVDGNFVVPDLVVIRTGDEPAEDDDVWVGRAMLAVEVRSPREDEAAKLADYRTVIEAGHLVLDELWYVDPGAPEVRVYEPRSGSRRARSEVFDVEAVARQLFGPA